MTATAQELRDALQLLEGLGKKVWYCTKVDAWELDIPVRCHDEGHEACHWILLLIPIPDPVAAE